MVPEFPLFKILKPSKKKNVFTSKQSGVIGLGPYTYNNKLDYKQNIVDAMRMNGSFSKGIVSYNITWDKPDISYIQIGSISEQVIANTSYQHAESFDHYGQMITNSLFQIADNEDG